MSRNPYTANAEAEWRAGKPRPKPCLHETAVDLQRHCDPRPVPYCARCGKQLAKEPTR